MSESSFSGTSARDVYNRSVMKPRLARESRLPAVVVGTAMVVVLLQLPRVLAQSAAADWEKAAGGKMAFDVASVKQNNAPGRDYTSNVSFGVQYNYHSSTGGLFLATHRQVFDYIEFANKLNAEQDRVLESQPELPKWINQQRFDIQGASTARCHEGPTSFNDAVSAS